VASRSFTSEAIEQFLPLGVRMLAAAGCQTPFEKKSQTMSKKAKPGKKTNC